MRTEFIEFLLDHGERDRALSDLLVLEASLPDRTMNALYLQDLADKDAPRAPGPCRSGPVRRSDVVAAVVCGLIGPDRKLYYTIGDLGNNQLGNYCTPIEAQRLPTQVEIQVKNYAAYVGKSLRLNLDGSIPNDNPEIAGVRSHVFTYGHRNPQGMSG